MSTLAALTVRIGADVTGFTRGVQTVTSELGRIGTAAPRAVGSVASGFSRGVGAVVNFGSKLGLATIGLKATADAAVGLGKAMLGPNASMEQTRIAFTTLLKDGKKADAFLRDLSKFAAATPFEFPELADTSRKLLAFGFTAESIIPTMTAIGDAVGALGGGPEVIDRVTMALGQMHAKGKVSAEEMMQLAETGIPAWDLLAKGIGKSTAETMKLASQGAIPADKAIRILTDGMEQAFGGSMQAQSKTFIGLLSTLKDNAALALRSFTGPIFDRAKGGLEILGNLVSSPAFQSFAETVGKGIGGAMDVAGRAIQTHVVPFLRDTFNLAVGLSYPLGALKDAVGNLAGAILGSLKNAWDALAPQPLIDGLKRLRNPVDGVREALGRMVPPQAADGVSRLSDLFYVLAPRIRDATSWFNGLADKVRAATGPGNDFTGVLETLGPIVANVIVPGLGTMWKHAGELAAMFQNNVVPAVRGFLPHLQSLADTIFTRVLPPVLQFVGAASRVVDVVVSAAIPALGKLIPPIMQVAGWIADGLNKALTFLAPYVSQAAKAVGQFASDLSTRLGPALNTVVRLVTDGLNFVSGLWNTVWPALSRTLEFVWGNIQNVVKIAWSLVSGIIKVGLDILGGKWQQAWEDIKSMLAGVWDGIKGLVGNALGFLKDILSGAWNAITGKVNEAWTNIKNGIAGKWNEIKSNVGNAIQQVKDNLGQKWDEIRNNISSKAGAIKDAILSPFNGAKDAIGGVLKGFGNGAISGINATLGAFEGMGNRFGDAINWVADKLGMGKPVPHIGLPRIPMLAKGTRNFTGGVAIVGEDGPELVSLPRGAAVLPAGPTANVLNGDTGLMGRAIPGFADGLGDFWQSVKDKAGGAASWVGDKVHGGLSAIGNAKDALGKKLGEVADWFGKGARWLVDTALNTVGFNPSAVPGLSLARDALGKFKDWGLKKVTSWLDFGGLDPAQLKGLAGAASAWWGRHITQPFRPPYNPAHGGVDFGMPMNTPLMALLGGIVRAAGYHSWGGEVDLATMLPGYGPGLESYVHLNLIAPNVRPGARIKPGMLVGWSGGQNAGGIHNTDRRYSNGPHLHYNWFKYAPWANDDLNPMRFLMSMRSRASQGGIVNRPTLVGEGEGPEAVIPLKRAPEVMGYRTLNLTLVLPDGRQLVQVVGREMADEIRVKLGLKA